MARRIYYIEINQMAFAAMILSITFSSCSLSVSSSNFPMLPPFSINIARYFIPVKQNI